MKNDELQTRNEYTFTGELQCRKMSMNIKIKKPIRGKN